MRRTEFESWRLSMTAPLTLGQYSESRTSGTSWWCKLISCWWASARDNYSRSWSLATSILFKWMMPTSQSSARSGWILSGGSWSKRYTMRTWRNLLSQSWSGFTITEKSSCGGKRGMNKSINSGPRLLIPRRQPQGHQEDLRDSMRLKQLPPANHTTHTPERY